MRLTASEVAWLPFCCALFDRRGRPVAQSPEWRGGTFGALTYEAGIGTLVVLPDGSHPDVDSVAQDLVAELLVAAAGLRGVERRAVEMLVAGLALVSGRPATAVVAGTVEDVVESAREGIRRSVPGLDLEVSVESRGAVPAPAAVALGIVQLARNARDHAGVAEVTLRVGRGPTFRVEWAADGDAAAVNTSRRPDQRPRWGMGFARLLADSLGGVVMAPAAIGPGVMASSIGLGAPRFSAPVAVASGGRVERASRAWDEETGLPPGSAVDQRVALVIEAAARLPGEVAYADVFRGRAVNGRTWLGVAPQSSLGRARDVLRGIQHENLLLTAAEPQATRVYALATVLAAVVTGEPTEAVPPATWERDFPRACAALGVAPTGSLDPDRLRFPDPRVCAFLLDELHGELVDTEGQATLALPGATQTHPLARLLGGAGGSLSLPA